MSNLHHYSQLIVIKVIGNLKAENARDYLGYCWWILEPLLQMCVYYFVFGYMLQRGTENYVAFLLTGLIPWLWFARTVNRSTMSIVSGKPLMMQVYIPKIIFPIMVIIQDTVKQCFIFLLLLLFLLLYGIPPSKYWIALPVLAIVQLIVITSFSFAVAAIVPFMNDLRFLIATGIQAMFFLSGVFFDPKTIAPSIKPLFFYNPMASLLQSYRDILIYHSWPQWDSLMLITIFCSGVAAFMWYMINRLDYVYPRVIL